MKKQTIMLFLALFNADLLWSQRLVKISSLAVMNSCRISPERAAWLAKQKNKPLKIVFENFPIERLLVMIDK